MSKKDEEFGLMAAGALVGCLAVLFVPALLVYLIASQAYVLSCCWAWFIVPLGFKALTFSQCVGVMFTYSAIKGFKTTANENDKVAFWALLSPWWLLVLAYIATLIL